MNDNYDADQILRAVGLTIGAASVRRFDGGAARARRTFASAALGVGTDE